MSGIQDRKEKIAAAGPGLNAGKNANKMLIAGVVAVLALAVIFIGVLLTRPKDARSSTGNAVPAGAGGLGKPFFCEQGCRGKQAGAGGADI